MAASSVSLLTATFVLSLLALQPRPTDAYAARSIEWVCRRMEEFGFCHNFFYSHMDPEKDLVELMVGVTAEAALANATDGLTWIRGSLANATDPDTKNSLTECENAYDLLVKAFTLADGSYKNADYSDVVFQEKGTPRAQMSCQLIWGTLENLMTERNRIMRMLTAMAVVSADYVNQCLTHFCPP